MHFGTQLLRWLSNRQQPLVSVLVVLAIVAASLGVPVALQPQKDTSRPFPCMHHRCGCGSADACWHGCCCMTLAQKLAWAEERGITPPDYALAQADAEELDKSQSPKACGSCSHRGCELAAAKTPAGTEVGLVLSVDFRRCNGLASLWLTMGHALPPKIEARTLRFRINPVSWPAVASQSAESPALSPATPPPRHS